MGFFKNVAEIVAAAMIVYGASNINFASYYKSNSGTESVALGSGLTSVRDKIKIGDKEYVAGYDGHQYRICLIENDRVIKYASINHCPRLRSRNITQSRKGISAESTEGFNLYDLDLNELYSFNKECLMADIDGNGSEEVVSRNNGINVSSFDGYAYRSNVVLESLMSSLDDPRMSIQSIVIKAVKSHLGNPTLDRQGRLVPTEPVVGPDGRRTKLWTQDSPIGLRIDSKTGDYYYEDTRMNLRSHVYEKENQERREQEKREKETEKQNRQRQQESNDQLKKDADKAVEKIYGRFRRFYN